MSAWDAFGLFAVGLSLLCYNFESRRPVFYSAMFAFACLMGSAYGFAKEAWPFGVVEIFWALSAFKKAMQLRTELVPVRIGVNRKH